MIEAKLKYIIGDLVFQIATLQAELELTKSLSAADRVGSTPPEGADRRYRHEATDRGATETVGAV